jgi:hypothetical protein
VSSLNLLSTFLDIGTYIEDSEMIPGHEFIFHFLDWKTND